MGHWNPVEVEFVGGRFGGFAGSTRDDHVDVVALEHLGDFLSDAARSSGDQGNLVHLLLSCYVLDCV